MDNKIGNVEVFKFFFFNSLLLQVLNVLKDD